MELCAEGTLENLISATENGLPEALLRRFTKQLVNGVDILHQNAIVHRDIKSKIFVYFLKYMCIYYILYLIYVN